MTHVMTFLTGLVGLAVSFAVLSAYLAVGFGLPAFILITLFAN